MAINIRATAWRLAAVAVATLALWGVRAAALAADECAAPAAAVGGGAAGDAVVDGGATPDVNDFGPRTNHGVVYH